MINSKAFTQKQFELTAEFGKYVFEHPEMDDVLPDGAHVFFEVEGEEAFNRQSRRLAQKQQQKDQGPVVIVHVKGLAPRQGSRLLDPVILPFSRPAPRRRRPLSARPALRENR
jgi:hypothetical protein